MKNLLGTALQETKGIITHTDLDGIISAAYVYHKTGKPLVGLCNLSNSGTTKIRTTEASTSLQHQLFLDLSIVDNNCWSIDHHYLPIDKLPHKAINANKYYEAMELRDKNPTGNILWLMFLFNEDYCKYSQEQLTALSIVDSTFANYNKYKDNMINWSEKLKFAPVLSAIEQLSHNKFYFNDLSIEKFGIHRQQQVTWYKDQYYYNYNTARGEVKVPLQEIFTKVALYFGWEPLTVPTFTNTIDYDNYSSNSLPREMNDGDNSVTFAAQKNTNLFFYSKLSSLVH